MTTDEIRTKARRFIPFCLLPSAFILSSCAAPTVNLATSEPIKVDIHMRLDVYQYGQTGGTKTAPAKPTVDQSPEARRRNRMADIQQFKNERLVGESHDGLVIIGIKPDGERGDYLRATVEAEIATIALGGPLAVVAAKKLVRQVATLPAETAFAEMARLSTSMFVSPEGQEGMAAFREKRRPAWVHMEDQP